MTRHASELDLRDEIERIVHRTTAIGSLVEQYTHPLDTPAWVLLRQLDRVGPQRASDLAEHGRMSRPSVSRCITALEQAGLVVARPDPDDGRAALLDLTAEGQRRLRHMSEVGHQRISELTADFTADEVRTLATLLARFNDKADSVAVAPARYRLEGVPS